MQSYARLNNIVYWLGLLLWGASLISAAVAAMNVFPVLSNDNLPMTIERYADFPQTEHARLAASHVMEPVFTSVDLIQFVAIALVLLTLVLQVLVFGMKLRKPATAVRAICIAIAACLFGYHVTALAPVMNGQLRSWWQAAEAGDTIEAERVRATFNIYHTKADSLLKANMFIVLFAISASAVAFTPSDET